MDVKMVVNGGKNREDADATRLATVDIHLKRKAEDKNDLLFFV